MHQSKNGAKNMSDSVRYRNNRARWALKDLTFLENNYSSMPVAKIAVRLGRTPGAVGLMAETLGVQSGRFWREAELEILTADYPRVGTAVTARLPGRNTVSVRIMAKRLGLKKSRDSNVGFRPWSDEEWALLEKNMHLSVTEQQAVLFPDRTKKAVEKARGRLIKEAQMKKEFK